MRTAILWTLTGLVIPGVTMVRAQEWSWREIGMEGMRLESILSPPDSSDIIYVSVSAFQDLPAEEFGAYKSTDGGATWRFLPESLNRDCGALTIDPLHQATVYLGSYTYFYNPTSWSKRTRDAGAHWEQFEEQLLYRIVPSPWIRGLLLATQTFGGYTLQLSTDDGETWQGLCGSEAALVSDEIIFHSEDSLMVFAGIYGGGPGGEFGLCRSRDGGYTWEEVLAGRVSSFSQDPANSDHWVAVSSEAARESSFRESFDNGDTWESRPLPDGILYVEQVFFDLWDSQTIYLGGASASFRLGNYRSTDGGYVWETMNQGLPDVDFHWEIQQVRDPPGEMLMARLNGGVWRWTNRVLADGLMLHEMDTLRIEEVTPCPFRDTVTARFYCESEGIVRAAIYSLDGRLVKMLIEGGVGAGRHEVVWDGRASDGRPAGPGAYVLRVGSIVGQAGTLVVGAR